MVARPSVSFRSVVVLLAALSSLGASYRTRNFIVEAATPAIAKQVGEYAEHYRKEKAIQWLGTEMPPWPQPCPLKVTVTMNGSGGATSFAFDQGQILHQDMRIEGTLERLLNSVLPHEVTHTVLAHYFRCPVPRWADEGGSVLSEDDIERQRHDQLVRQILNTPGRMIPLRRLFTLTQYPRDVMVLYAEGFSVTEFLVNRSNRQVFLTFVAHGMRGDWDAAVRTHYGFRNVNELEQAWLQHLRNTRRQPGSTMVASGGARANAPAAPTSRVVVRQTVPPAQPLLANPDTRPVYRGVPEDDADYGPVPSSSSAAPPYLPDRRPYASPSAAPPSSPGQLGLSSAPPPGVRLGPPRYDQATVADKGPPTAHLGRPIPTAPLGTVP